MSSLTTRPPLPAQDKFIRIHFGTTSKLAGADMESCESGPFGRAPGGRSSSVMYGVGGQCTMKSITHFKIAAEGH